MTWAPGVLAVVERLCAEWGASYVEQATAAQLMAWGVQLSPRTCTAAVRHLRRCGRVDSRA